MTIPIVVVPENPIHMDSRDEAESAHHAARWSPSFSYLGRLSPAPRSPWQNPYAERLIGTLRRECLDHVMICGERHLRRILTSYSLYYNETRTQLGLAKDAPLRRSVQRTGTIVTTSILSGLHHRYAGYDSREGQGAHRGHQRAWRPHLRVLRHAIRGPDRRGAFPIASSAQ